MFNLDTNELIDPGEVKGMSIFESQECMTAPKTEPSSVTETIQNSDSYKDILSEFWEFINYISEVSKMDF